MTNPLLVAAKGKGILPMLARGRVITGRYGLGSEKIEAGFDQLVETLDQTASSATIPVTASALAANPGAAQKYSARGLELAIHGLHHLDYSLMNLEKQVDHFRQANAIFDRLGVPVAGFRCPYLRWNDDTLAALRETGFVYDSSQALAIDVVGNAMTDPYRRVLEFYRAKSNDVYSALPGWSDGLIRIPYCLPDDEALVDRLHITEPQAMADIWLAMLEFIYQTGELFTLGLHPERAPLCCEALHLVLAKARRLTPGVWITHLREVAGWFRELGKATFEIQPGEDGEFHLQISAPERAVVLARGIETQVGTRPWTADYEVVEARNFTVRSNKRPLIGLAPGSDKALAHFLRHQGYLAEVSSDALAYSVYLDRRAFHEQDELALIRKLDRGRWPLVRLSRWPDATRCALVISGDLDAFTIWDYARRILVA